MVTFVATPIGNLGDITLRALETLRSADIIYCEDTRHSLKLLNYYDIKKPLASCHKFNERSAAEKIAEESLTGKSIAVITDAGMPVISDPGNILAQVLREKNVEFTVAPGACAFVSALVLSAFRADTFAFIGFIRGRDSEKRENIGRYVDFTGTLIFYSAPQDVDDDIRLLYGVLGDRKACAVREITKIHEETLYFSLASGLDGEKRGEYVLLVEGAGKKENPLNSLGEREHIDYYIRQGMTEKEALKAAAKDRGVSKSELYKYTMKDR